MKTKIRRSELLLCALVVLILGLTAQVVVNLSEVVSIVGERNE